jgi:hypothetical protein
MLTVKGDICILPLAGSLLPGAAFEVVGYEPGCRKRFIPFLSD